MRRGWMGRQEQTIVMDGPVDENVDLDAYAAIGVQHIEDLQHNIRS